MARQPGLLQTPEYARMVIRAADPNRDPREVERLVQARIDRQKCLTSDDSPLLWAVINEGVLRRVVGERGVMRQQFEHLLAMSRKPDITVQVLPFEVGAHPAMGYSFVHLRLSDPPDAAIVYLEDLISADYVEHPAHVANYYETFGLLTQVALSPEKSLTVIEQA